jgi:hypothetical protein
MNPIPAVKFQSYYIYHYANPELVKKFREHVIQNLDPGAWQVVRQTGTKIEIATGPEKMRLEAWVPTTWQQRLLCLTGLPRLRKALWCLYARDLFYVVPHHDQEQPWQLTLQELTPERHSPEALRELDTLGLKYSFIPTPEP